MQAQNQLRRAFAAFVLGAVGAATSTVAAAQGGTEQPGLDVVLPSGYDVQQGPLASGYPFNRSGMRVLYAYKGAAGDQREPMRIAGVGFRTWAQTNGLASWTFRLDVSTGVNDPASLDHTFDDNHGSDQTTVFDGNLLKNLTGVAGGPQPFEIFVPFSESFVWNPANGPLVLDFRMRARGGVTTNCDVANSAPVDRKFARIANLGNPEAVSADYPSSGVHPVGLITQLELEDEFVPAQASGALNSASSYPFNRPAGASSRTQLIYDGNLFGAGRQTINRIGFRPDAGAPHTGRTYDMKVTASTGAPGLSSGASNVFRDNHGADATVVFDGLWTTPTLDGTPTYAFTLELPFARGFDYDPARGALVLDIQVRDATGPTSSSTDGVINQPGMARVLGTSANAITGSSQAFGFGLAVHSIPAPTFPTHYASGQHSGTTAYPFNQPSANRVMNFYTGTSLGISQPITITHLSWRPRDDMHPTVVPLMVELSTSYRDLSNLSATFGANHGADKRVVFNDNLSIPFTEGGNDAEWFSVELTTPFRWDPAQGPLAVDLRKGNGYLGGSPQTNLSAGSGGVARIFHPSSANSSQAAAGPQAFASDMQLGGIGHNATARPHGTGCGSGHGVPVLQTRGLPYVGNTDFAFEVHTVRPWALAVLALGTSRASMSLDSLGFVGCRLLTNADLGTVPLAVDSNGEALLETALEPDSSLEGLILAAQVLVVDPTATGSLTTSQGLELTFEN